MSPTGNVDHDAMCEGIIDIAGLLFTDPHQACARCAAIGEVVGRILPLDYIDKRPTLPRRTVDEILADMRAAQDKTCADDQAEIEIEEG